MDGSVVQTWMSDILHGITQGLLVPDIVLLILFIGYALFCIGSILVEFFTERKHFKVAMPKFLAALMAAEEDGIPPVIEESGLLKRQKAALLTVYDYRMLPGDALVALIKRLVSEEESRYDRISGRNNMAARVSPMLGLMGTLIPLGPGIQALGKADTELLSTSLLIAFDTTVAGLVVAAICMVIGKIRGIWYGNYMSALDSAMATMLQKIEDMRAEGKIVEQEPSDYAFLFEQASAAKHSGKQAARRAAEAGSGETTPGGADKGGAPAPAPVPAPAEVSAPAPAPEPAPAPAVAAYQPPSAAIEAAVPAVAVPAVAVPEAAAPQGGGTLPAPTGTLFEQPGAAGWPASGVSHAATQAEAPVDAFKPLREKASFEPVPDPAFISDLAAAAAQSAAPANDFAQPAAEPAPLAPELAAEQAPGASAFPAATFEPYSARAFEPVLAVPDPAAPAPAETVAPAPSVQSPAAALETLPFVFPASSGASADAVQETRGAHEAAQPGEAGSASHGRHSGGWYQPRLRTDGEAPEHYTPPQFGR